VRHGESEGNVDVKVYARTPDSQIHLRGLVLGVDTAAVFFSPYLRTRETLQGLSLGYGGPRELCAVAVEDARICEHVVRGGELFSVDDFHERLEHCVEDPYFYTWTGGESMAVLEARSRDFCRDLLFTGMRDSGGAETVVIVSHAITLMCIFKTLVGGTIDELCCSKAPSNCEMVVLDWHGPTGAGREVGSGPLRYRLSMRVRPGEGADGPTTTWYEGDGSVSTQWASFASSKNYFGLASEAVQRRSFASLAHRSASEARF